MKKILVILLILLNCNNLFSEEKTITQERKETLLYGIDTQIKELLTQFKKEKTEGFEEELLTILNTTYDESIKSMIFDLFIDLEIKSGEMEALKIIDAIEYEEDFNDSYAIACLNYLSEINSEKAIQKVEFLLDNDNKSVISSTLKLIGNNKVKKTEDTLLNMLDKDDTDDTLYVLIIKTLGEIESQKALEKFTPILNDEDEETSVRTAVCYSLGEIGDPKSIPVLKNALQNRTNYLLRKSALEALTKFTFVELDDILIATLKDNQWQLREAAIKSLGERKVEKAFEILKYKANNDPEAKIKKSALQAIGDINSDECRDYLKEIFLDDKAPESSRLVASDKLIEHNVDWIYPSLENMFNEKNGEKKKPVLDYTLKLFSEKKYNYGSNLLVKLLNHENFVYQIYGIKGIGLNKFTEHKEKIKELSENSKNNSVKKNALTVLETL
ncbi:MAG: HEAT repeat domain-containing protein [Spirochaetales bacterium]|nr:HEAT repeat domain-containing protein [Spirochaetales bacterium]